jgi:6,7-dimethyl-8-ribityllumazine synthase
MVQFEGALHAGDEQYAIVVSRYNDSVTRRLLDGALKTFAHHGVSEDRITVAWVPGAFEIPLVAEKFASSNEFAAVCCLGAVIRGETTHDQHINEQVSRAIMQIGLKYGIPVLFGVLTCQTMEQAFDRAGGKQRKRSGARSARNGQPASTDRRSSETALTLESKREACSGLK